MSIQDLRLSIDNAENWQPPSGRRELPPTPPTLHEFLTFDFPDPEPLIGPFCRQQVALLAGEAGVGKTHLLIAMAMALHNGTNLLRWRVPEPRSVLFVDGEMPGRQLQDRFRAYPRVSKGAELRIVNAANWGASCGLEHPNLADPKWQEWIDGWAEGMDVIMLDNVMSLLSVPGASMSEDKFWKPAHDFNLRQRAAGRTVFWGDHLNSQGRVFGTKTKEWASDFVFTLEKLMGHVATDGAAFTVSFTKTRGLCGADVIPFEAKLTTGPDGHPHWIYKQAEDAMREKAWEYSCDGMTQREIAAEMNVSVGTINKLLKEARQLHAG